MNVKQMIFPLPNWLTLEMARLPECMATIEERMAAVIRFSQLNFEHGIGGPFAAGVFEKHSGKLLSIGINRVAAINYSVAHAEIMALSAAQQVIGSYDLGGNHQPVHQLVVSWMPCTMCYGAILWSGVRSLVLSGGTSSEAEDLLGFDEGPVCPNWQEELNKRGIELITDIQKEEAVKVLQTFKKCGGQVYNSRLGKISS